MKRSVVILLHLLYWMCFILLLAFIFIAILHSNPVPGKGLGIALYISGIIPGLISFYTFYTLLFSRFLIRKRILAFIAYGILICIISGIIGVFALVLAFGPRMIFLHGLSPAVEIALTIAVMVALPNGAIGMVLKGFIAWYGDIKLKAELNRKNYEIELALIRSHINPHFLFNTINNIDVLIARDAVKASDYLNKLSDIMRFMLYETKAETIEFAKELAYIEKYIALQMIRTSRGDYVNYVIEGNKDGLRIAPFVFIPFIENAFKHAAPVENAIQIKFVIIEGSISFYCENSYSKTSSAELNTGGLGNELIQKRQLLLYPNRHTLNITDTDGIYKVKLTIKANGY